MAYARFDEDSDVYVYSTGQGLFVMVRNVQNEYGNPIEYCFDDSKREGLMDALIFLLKQKIEGVKVPSECIERLENEIRFSKDVDFFKDLSNFELFSLPKEQLDRFTEILPELITYLQYLNNIDAKPSENGEYNISYVRDFQLIPEERIPAFMSEWPNMMEAVTIQLNILNFTLQKMADETKTDVKELRKRLNIETLMPLTWIDDGKTDAELGMYFQTGYDGEPQYDGVSFSIKKRSGPGA